MIEVGAGKPGFPSLKPHQRKKLKQTIKLGPNHHGLAILVGSFYLTYMLTRKLFAVYEPQDNLSLWSYMQAVDLVELKQHPVIVMVNGFGVGHLLRTNCGDIDINDFIIAPLFPPIATHLADNPKIFLFVVYSISSSEHLTRPSLPSPEPIWENYIVGYITCGANDAVWVVTHILQEELAGASSMSVQEIFTSIHDNLPPTATMTVIDHLKEPVYLHPGRPRRYEPMGADSRSQGIATRL